MAPSLPGPDIEDSIRKVSETGSPTVVTGLSTRYPGSVEPLARPVGAAEPDTAVILPLAAADQSRPIGVLVLVVSPYRVLDEEYRAFFDLVARQVTTALADARAYTAQLRRAEELAAERLHDSQRELMRFREIAEQTSDFVGMANADGVVFYLNPAGRRLLDIAPTDDVTATTMEQHLTERAKSRLLEVALPAAAADGVWAGEMEFARRDGAALPMWQVILAHRDQRGELEFFSTVARDLRERQQAQRALQEEAARIASEATSARLRAMVDGLAAIVWEADATTWEFTFVSDRAEELLGYSLQRWLGDPEFWPSIIHPEDRAQAVQFCVEGSAAGRDYNFSYRALAADGRVVWLHDVVHVVCDATGLPVELQGVMIDITEQKRAEHAAELLAEAGRLLAEPGSARDKLESMVRHTRAAFGDMAVVSVVESDGLLRRVAVAHADPAMQRALLELPPVRLPDEFAERYRAGRPMVVPITEQLIHSVAHDEADAQARLAFGAHTGLAVPLVADGQLFGVLSYVTTEPRSYDTADLTLAEELGRRAALMVQAERRQSRDHYLREITATLASASSVAEVAQHLGSVAQILGATGLSVYLLDPEHGLRLEHAFGYPTEMLETFALIRLDDQVPIADSARNGEPVWLRNRSEWTQRYPHLGHYSSITGNHAAAALPLLAAGRVVGTLALSFGTVREFPDDEREFALTLVATAAQAMERAVIADERLRIADTLQRSLLPQQLPELSRLGLAAHYQPGAAGTQAGGDWYDVIPLADARVAIVVGDVVGHGTPAAAVMGRLRNALAGYLLEGHPPATALEHLDHFASRVTGALGSSVACVVLNTDTGDLRWARAGHPPPLVIDREGARFLADACGTVLAVPGRTPFEEGATRLDPGTSVLLYTDGLVERRGEIIDDSLARLSAGAASLATMAPTALLTALLERSLHQPGPADDVAVIVARLLPEPLHERLPAHPDQLAALRRTIAVWAAAAGLSADTVSNLQLALGEATANAVEHAYANGTPGEFCVQVRCQPGGWMDVCVRDFGKWRPMPEVPGYRGRGLALIREVAADMALDIHDDGTEVRFRLAVP